VIAHASVAIAAVSERIGKVTMMGDKLARARVNWKCVSDYD
jgi:hypothetical protein